MKLYNTLSGQKEEFQPQEAGKVRMYVCGVTPYSDSHIGHAMSYIIFDTIRRYFKYRGYEVTYVQNVTDIDDKIIARSNERGVAYDRLAAEYTDSFHEDMKALNVMPPDVEPRATGMIPQVLKVVRGLIDKGFAYEAGGSVYFRVRNVPDYGKLSHRNLDDMMAGARIESSQEKEHPMDFVLWKAAKPGEPSWTSPWGEGRPGWHIECSAMSLTHLGETLDIHGGGQDLVFPHHENEIAQSESFTGKKPFARYWMHNGLVRLGAEKMSKSLGNLVTIKEALAQYSPDALRLFVLSSHYRTPLTYSDETLRAAAEGVQRLARASSRADTGAGTEKPWDVDSYRQRFTAAMDDDFNTPKALAVLFEIARLVNQRGDEDYSITQGQQVLSELAGVLGLSLKKPQATLSEATAFIELLVSTRRMLREAKQYQLADEIRGGLEKLGILLEDTASGTEWRQKH